MPPRLRLGLKIGILHVQVQHVPLLFLLICSNLFRCQIYIFILELVYVIICISQILFLTMITSLFANVMHNTYTVVSFLCFIELGEEIQNG